jgi:hypothetical protein
MTKNIATSSPKTSRIRKVFTDFLVHGPGLGQLLAQIVNHRDEGLDGIHFHALPLLHFAHSSFLYDFLHDLVVGVPGAGMICDNVEISMELGVLRH